MTVKKYRVREGIATSQLLERKDKKMTELETIFDMYMEDKKDSEEVIKKR